MSTPKKQTKQSSHVTKSHASKSTTVTEPLASSGEATATTAPANAPVTTPANAPVAAEPLAARVTSAIALLKQVFTILAITSTPLSAAEMKVATKFRKGGEQHIPTLADLSTEYGVEVPSRPTADMTANLALAQVLGSLLLIVTRLQTVLASEAFGYRSETWATATTLYQMLKKASVRQSALKADLAPLEQFFNYRHPSNTAGTSTPDPSTKKAKRAKRLANEEKTIASHTPAGVSDAPATNGSTSQAAPVAPVTTSTPTHS